jgi:hypothetical protein
MIRQAALSTVIGSLVAFGYCATPALAQNPRAFVSAINGSDSNPCSRAFPCRTFAFAITLTNPGGEIDTLDPGGYGAVTITKSVSIVSGLGEAGVLVPTAGTGITINAGPTDVINLRGLLVEGAGVGQNGIQFNSGGTLTIEQCVVRNLTNNGIALLPSASSKFEISDTFVANANGGNGIVVQPTGSFAVNALFNRVEVDNNGDGILVVSDTANLNATVSDSVIAGNSGNGLDVEGALTNIVTMMVFHSVVANNHSSGLFVSGGSTALRIGQSTVTGNVHGWVGDIGNVLSYGNNQIDGNTNDEMAPPSIPNK